MSRAVFPSFQEDAPKTAQDWLRSQPAVPREDPPLPPPVEAPEDAKSKGDLLDVDAAATHGVEELAKKHQVSLFKQHAKVSLDAFSRKFMFTSYGSERTAVLAAAEFRRRCKELMVQFDGLSRQRDLRMDVLTTYGSLRETIYTCI